MFNNKFVLTIGALLLATVAVAAAQGCPGCRGTELLYALNSLDASRRCWFTPKNHVLLELKVSCLTAVNKLLEDIYETTNAASSFRCRSFLALTCVQSFNQDVMAKCTMNNLKIMAQNYRKMELCNGKVLVDPAKLDLVFKVIGGSIRGWQVPHPEC